MAKLGTLYWIEETNGKTNWAERLSLIAQGVRARMATQKRLRANEQVRIREVHEIFPPDTAIAREALDIARDCSPPSLFNHCLRAYFWA